MNETFSEPSVALHTQIPQKYRLLNAFTSKSIWILDITTMRGKRHYAVMALAGLTLVSCSIASYNLGKNHFIQKHVSSIREELRHEFKETVLINNIHKKIATNLCKIFQNLTRKIFIEDDNYLLKWSWNLCCTPDASFFMDFVEQQVWKIAGTPDSRQTKQSLFY